MTYEELRATHVTAHAVIRLRRGEPLQSVLGTQRADTDAFSFGRAAHVMLLEGTHKFLDTHKIGGPVNPRTGKPYNRGTKKFADWQAEYPDHNCVTTTEYDMILAMQQSIFANRAASHLLSAGDAEVTIRQEYCGVPAQSRLDWISTAGPKASAIVDLKTTSDINGFAYDIDRYFYHAQMAFYREMLGHDAAPIYLIAVQKTIPSQCVVIQLYDHILDAQRTENETMLCSVRDEFLSYLEDLECQNTDK